MAIIKPVVLKRSAFQQNQPALFQYAAASAANNTPAQFAFPQSEGIPAWLTAPTSGGNPWNEVQRPAGQIRRPWGEVIPAPNTPPARPVAFEVPGQSLAQVLAANGAGTPVMTTAAAPVVDPGPRDTNFFASAPLPEVRAWQAQRAAFAQQQKKAGT
jgi:hypothetical protein